MLEALRRVETFSDRLAQDGEEGVPIRKVGIEGLLGGYALALRRWVHGPRVVAVGEALQALPGLARRFMRSVISARWRCSTRVMAFRGKAFGGHVDVTPSFRTRWKKRDNRALADVPG
jgi:hypothetical protein